MNITKPPPPSLHSQQGSAMIEFLITAVAVLLLGLGATETARWYIQKQHIRYALHEAQRVATVAHAKPELIVKAFEEALNPLFSPAGRYKSVAARRTAYLNTVSQKTTMSPWRMSIISPTSAHFKDFKQNNLQVTGASGLAVINNNYQFEQHQDKGLGLHSQESIYEANILSINLIYPYRPLVPGVANLMKSLSSTSNSQLKQNYYAAGYLPLEISSHMGMQSHPVQWPSSRDAKAVWNEDIIHSDKITTGNHTIEAPSADCAGLWCPDATKQNAGVITSGQHNRDNVNKHGSYQPPQSGTVSNVESNTNHLAPDSTNTPNNELLDDPLCGSSLCCN